MIFRVLDLAIYFHCVVNSGIMDVFVGLCVPKFETQKIFEVIEL